MREKPLVVMDISSTGKSGGPFISSTRVMNSGLKEKYDFKTISYKTEIGRLISIKRILDLRKQLVDLKPDIVHFTGLQLSGFHVAVACKLANLKNIVVTVHGFSGDAIGLNPIKRFLLTYILEPLTILMAKKVYGVSNYVASRNIMRLFSYKSCGGIYNFPPNPYESKGVTDIREELGLSSDDVVAVSVARIIKDKGYHILSDAILQFANEPQLKFLIVGNGDYLPAMKEKLKEQVKSGQVIFLGYREDVQRIIHGCDFFILPTLHETLSIALLEASIEGLALIASNTGGVPEIVGDQYNGLLVPPGDVSALTSAIDTLYRDDKLRRTFAKNAQIHVAERFNNKEIEERIDKVYKEILKK